MMVSVSHTTRLPRPGEQEGVHYYFVSVEEFETLIEKGHFLEYAKVYDNYYGTPKEHVMNLLEEGKSVILEIDIQGAMKVKESYSDCCLYLRCAAILRCVNISFAWSWYG